MSSILAWLQKHLIWSIPGAMLLGLAYGRWADGDALRWAIMPLTFLMVYPMMVTLNLRALAYVVQVQAAAWYVRFTDRLFGRPAGLKQARRWTGICRSQPVALTSRAAASEAYAWPCEAPSAGPPSPR